MLNGNLQFRVGTLVALLQYEIFLRLGTPTGSWLVKEEARLNWNSAQGKNENEGNRPLPDSAELNLNELPGVTRQAPTSRDFY